MRLRFADPDQRAAFIQWLYDNFYVEAADSYQPRGRVGLTGVNKRGYYRRVYLRTEHWAKLRFQKLRTTAWCERCGISAKLDPHHLVYRKLYDCTVDDLMSLCRTCHRRWHRRGTRALLKEYQDLTGVKVDLS